MGTKPENTWVLLNCNKWKSGSKQMNKMTLCSGFSGMVKFKPGFTSKLSVHSPQNYPGLGNNLYGHLADEATGRHRSQNRKSHLFHEKFSKVYKVYHKYKVILGNTQTLKNFNSCLCKKYANLYRIFVGVYLSPN